MINLPTKTQFRTEILAFSDFCGKSSYVHWRIVPSFLHFEVVIVHVTMECLTASTSACLATFLLTISMSATLTHLFNHTQLMSHVVNKIHVT